MEEKRIGSYVRTYRKKSGLTQNELATLMGHKNAARISSHERGVTLPSLTVALHYEALFRIPVSELFPSVYETATRTIETRLAEMESSFAKKSAKDPDANATARKLQFIWARKTGLEI